MTWYWIVFVIAALILFVAVPLAYRWERRQDRLDHELWDEMYAKPHGPQYELATRIAKANSLTFEEASERLSRLLAERKRPGVFIDDVVPTVNPQTPGWPGPPFDFEADARWHDHA